MPSDKVANKMTDVNPRFDRMKLEELLRRVREGEKRDPMLDCQIAVALQYVADALVVYSNVRAHPTSTITMLYDAPEKEATPVFIPMLTSSIDAVEKLRAWGVPAWKVDGLQAKNGEYIVRASCESGATVQAVARTEVRARLAAILQAFQRESERKWGASSDVEEGAKILVEALK